MCDSQSFCYVRQPSTPTASASPVQLTSTCTWKSLLFCISSRTGCGIPRGRTPSALSQVALGRNRHRLRVCSPSHLDSFRTIAGKQLKGQSIELQNSPQDDTTHSTQYRARTSSHAELTRGVSPRLQLHDLVLDGKVTPAVVSAANQLDPIRNGLYNNMQRQRIRFRTITTTTTPTPC